MSADKLLSGSHDNLPKQPSSLIRVFFSSTFTDMSEERNKLMRDVIPELRLYCLDRGFEFEVVDMRWGVRDDAETDHATTDLCLKQIQECQNISQGPNFVLFLGDKYGSRPLPNQIPVTEFRLFRRLASWMQLSFEIVEKWYLLDTNAIPHVYQILPITTLLPFFNNMNPVNNIRRLTHIENWVSDERTMRNVFRKVAAVALEQNKISQEAHDKYFVSVTEHEVDKGIILYPKLRDRVLCFQRTLTTVDYASTLAKRFTDLTKDGDIDEEAKALREKLANEKLCSIIPPEQMVTNSVYWTSKGIDPENDIHAGYLDRFCETFKTLMLVQINSCFQAANEQRIENELIAEVLTHLEFCNRKCECHYGQDDLLRDILNRMYIEVDTNSEGNEAEKKEVDEEGTENAEVDGDDEGGFTSKAEVDRTEDADTDEAQHENKNDGPNESDEENKGDIQNTENDGEEERKIISAQGEEEEETEEKVDADEKEKEENEEKPDEKNMDKYEEYAKEIEQMKTMYKAMGDKGPTFGFGEVGRDLTSDPLVNMKAELVAYNCSDTYKRPVVIHGESGSGKTALMAKLVHVIKQREPHSVVIIRFLGTTRLCNTIRSLLINVIENIWVAYKMNPNRDLDFTSDIIYLGQYLRALIWKVASPSRPLYILLDSLDQLAPLEQAHGLAWLPVHLPIHCSIVLSCLPNVTACYDNARRILPYKEQFVEVPVLGEQSARKIISAICHSKSRALTHPQRKYLIDHFAQYPFPLYLKLITEQALKWRSHQQVKDLLLGSDTTNAIIHLLMMLERTHGIILVSKALGFLTCMKQGVAINELDDLLSLDNEVLRDTYVYHLPPNPHKIRLAPSLLSRLLLDLKEYITFMKMGCWHVMTWYHRQFHKVAAERYLTEEVVKMNHHQCARYFLNYWHNKVKPLRLDKEKIGWYPDNTRLIPEQNLYLKDGQPNVRKLVELPHHLIHAGMWRDFHREVVCNIDFLVAKIKAVGPVELRADIMMMLMLRDELSEEEMEEPEDTESKKEKVEEEPEKVIEVEKEEDADQPVIDEDLFLTENKKQEGEGNEKVEENADEEEDTMSEDAAEDEERAIKDPGCPDLQTALKEMEILLDILTLGMESLKQSPFNLPAQIICQIGKNRATTPGLQKLVCDSFTWMTENNRPMLVPQDACMPPPGEILQTSLSIDMHLMGSDREQDFPMQLYPELGYLYVIQQAIGKTDLLMVLDLHQGGEKVMVEDTKAHIHSFHFNPNKKFLIMCYYTNMSAYHATFAYRLFDGVQLNEYKLDKEAKCMDVSRDGDIVAFTDERTCYICSPKHDTFTMEVIFRLHHTEAITNILFSPDAYYLLSFSSGDGFKVWVPRRGESTLLVEGEKKNRYSLKDTSGEMVRITANQRLLQVLSGLKKRNTLRIYDLATGNIQHELSSSELHYDINFMEMDEGEEYVLVATAATSLINNNRAKSALVWDIETGKLISRVTSEKAFRAVKLLIKDTIIYVLASMDRDSSIYVYSLGLTHRPFAGAKLIRQVSGHVSQLLQLEIVMSPSDSGANKLFSAGSDNSVKIWDLKQVLSKPPPRTEEEKIGASVVLVGTKQGDAVCFATENGYIVHQNIQTGERTYFASNLEGVAHIMLVSRNGNFLVAAVKNHIFVYYIETGELEYELESCLQSSISCMAENNNILIAGHSGMEGKGRLWDLSNGRVLKDVSYLYSFYKTAVNSRGTQYGVTMFEYPLMLNVFDMGDGEGEMGRVSMEQVDSMMSACSHLEFSPDGNMLASASGDGRLRIIETETGRYLHTMVQKSSVSVVLFTWDSRYVLTAGYRSIYIWCVGQDHPSEKSGQLEIKLTRHGDFVTNMKLVLEDLFLITASLDKIIALWNMKTKTALCSFRAHCPIKAMVVAPDVSSISFIPERSANVAVLTLNKAGQNLLSGVPNVPVPAKIRKAQAVALSFSSQQVVQKTSVACSIL